MPQTFSSDFEYLYKVQNSCGLSARVDYSWLAEQPNWTMLFLEQDVKKHLFLIEKINVALFWFSDRR